MPSAAKLIPVFEEARRLVALPDNEFIWSSWRDTEHALEEIDGILSALTSAEVPEGLSMRVIFAPTGPMQELSIDSGWGQEFLDLADRFDDAMASD